MKVTYLGPNETVEVHVGDGHYVGVTRGVPVDVPEAVGKNLIEQGWDSGTKKESA